MWRIRRLRLSLADLVVVWILIDVQSVAAYIDPGTGSALFYLITGVVVAIYFAIRGLYYRALDLMFRVRRRDQTCEVAIHCEAPRYEATLLPLAGSLAEIGIPSTFFTMYERDNSFEPLPAGVAHRSIAPGLIGYAYLNNVQATILVTTTPQLDVMTFRRSPRVKHYAHIPHALGESRYVRPYAYDYFDSVLCCGPLLRTNIRRMEALRGELPKELLETGVPHYEDLLAKARTAAPLSPDPVVLIAPSWGPLSMFEAFGTGFVREIARHYRVIVRPHPQMRQSQAELYHAILSLDGVTIDTERTPSTAMSKAHILLSDISGITHEFAFIYERPVITVDRQQAIGGLEGELLGGDSDLKERCRDFIIPLPPAEVSNIVGHIQRTLAGHSTTRLAAVREELVYNFGTATRAAADQLAAIYRREQSDSKVNIRNRFVQPSAEPQPVK
jgi:hypothetical protein